MDDLIERLRAPAYWMSGSSAGHEGENNAPREAVARIEALEADNARLMGLLANLQALEAEYRLAHDLHGDGSPQAGRAWDLMRRAGDAARTTLAKIKEATDA